MARLTVEDCLAIEPTDVMAADWWTRRAWRGELTWALNLTGETVGAIAFEVEGDSYYRHVARLAYTLGEKTGEPVILEIHLDCSRPGFGGQRWYFQCPAPAAVGVCARRVSKLYFPPGGVMFACRECHELTYRSCQASRRSPSEAGLRRVAERILGDRRKLKAGGIARSTASGRSTSE